MSMHVKNNHIRYCPFCGKPFTVQLNKIRFCPFCGENLQAVHELAFTDKTIGSADAGAKPVEQRAKSIAINPLLFAGQPQKKSDIGDQVTDVKCNSTVNSSFYSLVLKYCSTDHGMLARKLQDVLLRSPRAIQLALENVPCVLIYKGRAEKVLKALTVCKDAGAVAILFAEDINLQAHINDVYPDFYKLPKDLQIFLKSIPHKLWIGENIAGIYSVVTQEKGSGALIIGEHALYFVGRQYNWLVVSYHQIQGIYGSQEALEIEYQAGGNAESFYLDDKKHLEQAFVQLQNALEREQRRWQVEVWCPECSFHVRGGLFTAIYDTCPQCGRQPERKIFDNKR